MRTQILFFASLLAACPATWAEQSALETLGAKTAEKAVKSALPSEAKQGLKVLGEANAAKNVLDKGPAALEKKAEGMAEQKALGAAKSALPGEAKEGVKAAEEAASVANKAKKVEGMVKNPSGLANQAVKSAEGQAKKKAMDSALDMLH